MRLTVLGGAAACPGAGQGSSSYLLEVAGRATVIDCGPDTISELQKHRRLDEIDRIIVSHIHADHTLDLVPFRYGLKYMPGIERRQIPLWMPPNGAEYLERVARAFAMGTESAEGFFDSAFEVRIYDDICQLDLEEISVNFFRTNHPVPCWAMRINSNDGTLVYLADTGPQDNLAAIARDADILVCEGTIAEHAEVEGIEERPHLSAWEAGCIAREAGVDQLLLTHLWTNLGPDVYREQVEAGFEREVHIARPGLTIEVPGKRSSC